MAGNTGLYFSNDTFESAAKIVTKVYSKTVVEVTPQYQKVLNQYENDPQRGFMTYLALRGMTTAAIMPEGTAPILQQMSEGESQTFNLVDYGLGYAVTKKAMEYDPKAILSRAPKFLVYSAQITEELLCWQPINLGTTINSYDGVPLFSTAHPLQLQPSVTVSNYAGSTAISVEALQAGIVQMNLTVDDQNLPTYRTPKQLVVGTGITQQVGEVLGAKGYPYSDENRPNVVAGALDLVISRFITGSTAWYIFAGKGDPEGDTHSLFYSFQKKDEQRTWQEPSTENMFHSIQFRLVYGNLDWRGAYGSLGA
jgi:hypothetical protein